MFAVIALAIVSSAAFLRYQTLWLDEATQMSGLTLSPVELTRWLAGLARHDFGVPGDRMPPVSYWLGWVWSRIFGLNETSMRWFGVACRVGAVALVFRATRRLFGVEAAAIAGALLALSPNVTVASVEIRAYPVFILTAAGTVDALSMILSDPEAEAGRRAWPWIRLGVWMVLCVYTHFFGLVLAGAVLLVLFVLVVRGRQRLKPVLGLAGIILGCAVALVPFVRASIDISDEQTRHRLRETAQMFYRVVGHPVLTVQPVATALALLSVPALFLCIWHMPPTPRRSALALVGVLSAGLICAALANGLMHGFTAAKPMYSTWTLPVVSMALAAPIGNLSKRWGAFALSIALLLVGANAFGAAELALKGDLFSHGPQRQLQAMLDGLGRDQTAIVHAEPTDPYPFVFFPCRYVYGTALTQFVAERPSPTPILGTPLDVADPIAQQRLLAFRYLMLVRSREESAADLVRQIHRGPTAFGPTSAQVSLESAGWTVREQRHFLSFLSVEVVVLERSDRALQRVAMPTVRLPVDRPPPSSLPVVLDPPDRALPPAAIPTARAPADRPAPGGAP
jgi:hypothetical protein